jgi:hypothetical protein
VGKVVSIIIVNYNGLPYLKECLASIQEQSYPEIEVICVDNGSQDGSPEFIQQNYPHIKIIVNEKNLGFCRGNNLGILAAKGEYVFLLNNDTKLEASCVENMVREIEQKPPHCIGVIPKVLFYDEPLLINSYGVIWHHKYHWRDNRCGLLDLGQFKTSEKVFGSMFAAILFKKKELIKIGLFDEDYFCYGEDFDISYRVNIFGYTFFTAPQAIVYHKFRTSSRDREQPEWAFYYFTRNYLLTFFKNYQFRSLLANFKQIVSLYYWNWFKYFLRTHQWQKLWLYPRVAFWLFFHLGKIIKKRKFIEVNRKLEDSEVWDYSDSIGSYNLFHYNNHPVLSLRNLYTARGAERETLPSIGKFEKILIEQNKFNSTTGELYGLTTYGQEFRVWQNGLSRIDLLLGTYKRQNTQDIIFHLCEKLENFKFKECVKIIVNASQIKDNEFYSFKFKPLINSKGKSYYFYLESPYSRPGDAITLYTLNSRRCKFGQMYKDNKPTRGSLTFKVFARVYK